MDQNIIMFLWKCKRVLERRGKEKHNFVVKQRKTSKSFLYVPK